VSFGLTSAWIGIDFGFRPKLVVQIGSQPRPFLFAMNLLAIAFVIALLRALRSRKTINSVQNIQPL
jgi:hypothetical protein